MNAILRPPVHPSKWLTMMAVCLGLGMLMIDTFVVNVAFPAIGRDLNAELGKAEWTVSGYVLMLGVFPLAMGRLGDILGRRLVYLGGLVVFVLASTGCGLAQDINQLIALRLLQGLGAAVMMPGTLSIVTSAFPPEQRGLAIGVWGGVSGIGLIAGPILGGLLVTGDSWRWIFLVNVPVGVIALLMAIRFVPESRDPAAPRSIDWAGAVLLAGGLGSLLFGLTEANTEGWGSAFILGCFFAGSALLVAFAFVELRRPFPLIDLRLFRNGTFTMACVSAFLFSAAVFGSQPFASLFMQNTLGFSALEGGFGFLPATVLVALLMPFSGIIGQKLGDRLRILIIGGSLLVGASFVYLVLFLDVESGYVDGLLAPFLLRGLGIGLFMSASSLAVMSSLPVARAGLASGTLTMFRQVGTAVGVAAFGAVFLRHIHNDLPARLADTTADQAAVTAAAEHFVVPGGPGREAARRSIVDGYVLIAVTGLLASGVAAGTSALIRTRTSPAARASGAGQGVAPTRSPGG